MDNEKLLWELETKTAISGKRNPQPSTGEEENAIVSKDRDRRRDIEQNSHASSQLNAPVQSSACGKWQLGDPTRNTMRSCTYTINFAPCKDYPIT